MYSFFYFQRVPAVVDQQDGPDVAGILPALEQPQKQLADSARPPATGVITIAFFSVYLSLIYKISGLPGWPINDPFEDICSILFLPVNLIRMVLHCRLIRLRLEIDM